MKNVQEWVDLWNRHAWWSTCPVAKCHCDGGWHLNSCIGSDSNISVEDRTIVVEVETLPRISTMENTDVLVENGLIRWALTRLDSSGDAKLRSNTLTLTVKDPAKKKSDSVLEKHSAVICMYMEKMCITDRGFLVFLFALRNIFFWLRDGGDAN